ncbi:MAG: orotidine-5'-phosphate decarboxylase [bacterium]
MRVKSEVGKKIIVALDVENAEEALSLVQKLDAAEIFKVGLRLFTAEGPSLLEKIRKQGKMVFLDLKLHDIPSTVAEAVRAGVRHDVAMMTLHASGGKEMMIRAEEAARDEAEKRSLNKPFLLGVTVLTSLRNEDLKELGIREGIEQHVLRLARLVKESGLGGAVCSARELEIIRSELGKDFTLVVPGIRPALAAAHDQKRIMTPAQALEKGAGYLVIGRPIIKAPSPEEAFSKIVEELTWTIHK